MTAATQPAPLDLDALEAIERAPRDVLERWDGVPSQEENHARRVRMQKADAALPALLAEARENRTSRDRIAELERENAELREALKPFALIGDDEMLCDAEWPDDAEWPSCRLVSARWPVLVDG